MGAAGFFRRAYMCPRSQEVPGAPRSSSLNLRSKNFSVTGSQVGDLTPNPCLKETR
jgi:hypothetical protein